MLSKDILEEVLHKAVSTGADFAEIYEESTEENTIETRNGDVEKSQSNLLSGAGIRIIKGTNSVYGSISTLTRQALLDCAESIAYAACNGKGDVNISLKRAAVENRHPVKLFAGSVENKRRVEVLGELYAGAGSGAIRQVMAAISEQDRKIQIANSQGLLVSDRQVRVRLGVQAVAANETENQTGGEGFGRHMGFEACELADLRAMGKKAADRAVTMLNAAYCPGGTMPVVIGSGFGGAIFHEACGHPLEACAIARNCSEFVGKLGQQIANTKVTAVDDATIPNSWGSNNIDDEGSPSQRIVLIENGILKSYLVDRLNGQKLGLAPTASCRRENYTFQPTSRMTNTYIAAGDDDEADIIASVAYGLYAKEVGGGSVNPATGDFNFVVSEGYLIRNGKIAEPVRGAMLIGKGSRILMDIDMVGKKFAFGGPGYCGASSGRIPNNCGQPMIRVASMTVGGR